VTQVLTGLGGQARYNPLRQQIMALTPCSKRTAQLAIIAACQQGVIIQDNGDYRLAEERLERFVPIEVHRDHGEPDGG
jgi:hypothetical protein